MSHRQGRVWGVGINNAPYSVAQYNGAGTQVELCPFYRTWRGVLQRCYDSKFHSRHTTYAGCTVCAEWITFSNFKAWMEVQDWEGKHLDKDVLVLGNKHYSPETCAFIDHRLNSFITSDIQAPRGSLAVGVSWRHKNQRFQARCVNPFTQKRESLGLFPTEAEAHEAWRKRKHELACQYATLQTDPRVADALTRRYEKEQRHD